MKASAFGYPFLFFSAIFYLFIGFVLSQPGATNFLTNTSGLYNNSSSTDLTNFVNPFSNVGFLVWLGIAIAFVDGYIILSSIT